MNNHTTPITSLLATLLQPPKSQDLALVRCPPPGACVPAVIDSTPVDLTTPPVETRLLHGRPRTGAVASLPKDKRDLVCRLIGRGVPYKKIAQAIEQLGFVITERNISNWVTHGGYAEWCALYNDALQTSLRQDDLLQHHRSDNSPDLAEVGLQSAAVRLSELLLRETALTPGADANVSKLEPAVTLLCRINKELLNLQKYRDDCQTKAFRTPARLRAKDHDKLVEVEAKYSAGRPRKLLDNERPYSHRPPAGQSRPIPLPVAQTSAADRQDSTSTTAEPRQTAPLAVPEPNDPQQTAPVVAPDSKDPQQTAPITAPESTDPQQSAPVLDSVSVAPPGPSAESSVPAVPIDRELELAH